jgi:hypothetical protein
MYEDDRFWVSEAAPLFFWEIHLQIQNLFVFLTFLMIGRKIAAFPEKLEFQSLKP